MKSFVLYIMQSKNKNALHKDFVLRGKRVAETVILFAVFGKINYKKGVVLNMYKHNIHKGFTYLIFIYLSIIIISISVPAVIEKIDEYTYMYSLLFIFIGSFCFAEIYFPISENIKEKGMAMSLYRYFFIMTGYALAILLVFFLNWLFTKLGLLNRLKYTFYASLGGFVWLISKKIALIFPNVPNINKEQ